MAITPVTQQFSTTTYGTAPWTTPTPFTPPDNCILWIFTEILNNAAADPGSGSTPVDNLGAGALTYTNRAYSHQNLTFSHSVTCWTAPVTTGALMAITLDDAAQAVYQYVITIAAQTSYDAAIVGGNAVVTADVGDGAETLTLDAAPATADVTFAMTCIDDSGNAANPTMGTGSWFNVYDGVSNLGSNLNYRTGSTSTSVPWTDVYTGAGAFDKGILLAIVAKAGAGGPAPTPVLRGVTRSGLRSG